MAALHPSKEVKDFRFRRLEKPEEFRAVAEIQREALGLEQEPPVPVPLQRAIQDNGGLVLGAFADIHLAGFALGFLAWDGKQLYHYSHMTAVRPEYQNHHVGFRLKAFQRDEVLSAGLPVVRWTFDPLRSRNAYLNVRRLGGVPDRYLVHYYGQLGSAEDRGLETDRIRVTWAVASPKVEQRLRGELPNAAQDLAVHQSATPMVETEAGDTGMRLPTAVAEPTAASATIEIPFDLELIRTHEAKSLRTWRHATRDAFRMAFDLGYRVEDFAVIPLEHERRSFYFLRKNPPPADAPPPAS